MISWYPTGLTTAAGAITAAAADVGTAQGLVDRAEEYVPIVLQVFDLIGVFAFAVSGALLAVRRGYDIVGSLLLASLVGLGGGVVRDLVINQGVPNAFAQPIYLVPPLLAALLVFVRVIQPDRLRRSLLVFDAVGLSVFCVIGTRIALLAGIHPVPAALLGVTTAVVGGLLRDTVANADPDLFNARGVYAVPALFGAAVTSALFALGWLNSLTGLAVIIAVFAVRLLALRYRWRVPEATLRRAKDA